MAIPDDLVNAVRAGECILFLGAMASVASPAGSTYQYRNAPPSGNQLSRHLATVSGYPYDDVDNLQRVALHFEMREHVNRKTLVDEIRGFAGFDNLETSPALDMLAELPFRIVLTTNYDKLFESALWRKQTLDGKPKLPRVQVYHPRTEAEFVSLDNPENKPVVLKLHGDIDEPDSIVITEEDYIRFVQRMGNEHMHPIPGNIRARMQEWPVLFIGYSLRDFNLRLLLRTLHWGRDAGFALSYSVDPKPDNLIVAVQQRSGAEQVVTFLQVDLWDFVPELHRRVKGGK